MLTIGQVARQAGLRTTTLRYYESIGILAPPVRVSGQRRYDERVFRQLAVIKVAQRAGFTMAQIHMLLHEFPDDAPPPERWRAMAHPRLAEVQVLMRQLQESQRILEGMLECECHSMDECATCVEQSGNQG